MSVVARRLRSTPYRTASETWREIATLICQDDADAASVFAAVAGTCASIIADEVPKGSPFVVKGTGPRLRVYCLYGEDAVIPDNGNEDPLTWSPLDDDGWTVFVPCPGDELEWVSDALKAHEPAFQAYDAAKPISEDSSSKSASTENDFTVDLAGLRDL